MFDIFITSINIKNVRNHKSFNIELSKDVKKNLIITGKNGSGKTTLLNAITKYLESIPTNSFHNIQSYGLYYENIRTYERLINDYELQIKNGVDEETRRRLLRDIDTFKADMKNTSDFISKHTNEVEIEFNSTEYVQNYYNEGNFILAYFPANRLSIMDKPDGIKKVNFNDKYTISEHPSNLFINYLVSLKAQRSFARDEGDSETAEKIDNWFLTFESSLNQLFENSNIKLEFDYTNFNFNIVEIGKEKYTFNTLSDGYSAILSIITDLIIRMENKRVNNYDLQGIVLIDEIETHLHVSLQKKILPFLMGFFPRIQFVVTTHSPFIINSTNNSFIFDLEKNILLNDLSAYSYVGILESYFNIDMYSDLVKNKILRYEALAEKYNDLSTSEMDEFMELKKFLKDVPDFVAPELKSKFYSIELKLRG